MTPTLGRIVIYSLSPADAAAAGGGPDLREYPAIITRVWTDSCVNLCVFVDGGPPEHHASVTQQAPPSLGVPHAQAGWRWPDLLRVPVSNDALGAARGAAP